MKPPQKAAVGLVLCENASCSHLTRLTCKSKVIRVKHVIVQPIQARIVLFQVAGAIHCSCNKGTFEKTAKTQQERCPGENAFCSNRKTQFFYQRLPACLPPSQCCPSAWAGEANDSVVKVRALWKVRERWARRRQSSHVSKSTHSSNPTTGPIPTSAHRNKRDIISKSHPNPSNCPMASQLLWGPLRFGLPYWNFMVCPPRFFPRITY